MKINYRISFETINLVLYLKYEYPKPKKRIMKNLKLNLLIILSALFCFSMELQAQEQKEVFIYVESMPEPQEGMAGFYKYITQNLKYPSDARKAGIEGKVFLQFVVTEDGKLTDAKILKGLSPELDQEALRVINNYKGLWKPGKMRDKAIKVRMSMPIVFKLGKETEDENTNKPLVILDGKEIPYDQLKDIDPKNIEKIEVWKSEKGFSIYGGKAKDGVILITTRNHSDKEDIEITFEEDIEIVEEAPDETVEEAVEVEEESQVETFTEKKLEKEEKTTKVYPNPAVSFSKISLTTDKSEKVKIELVDMKTQQVKILAEKTIEAGTHDFELNIQSLKSDLYLIRVTRDGSTTFHRILVEK